MYGRPPVIWLFFLSASVAMVQAGYLFHDVYRPLSSYQFESQMFQRVQAQLGAISSLPVPLPYRYLKGLDAVIFHEPTGLHQGRVYLRGERRKGAGFLTYYLVAVLFKVPIAGLILFGAALVDLWSKRRSEKFWHNEIVLLLPCLFFFLYLSCFFNAQFGLRYLLPAFPLGFIFCGRLASGWRRLAARRKVLLVLLVLYFGSSSLSYHPHYLSYFNELLTDRKMAYKILADSNLEWGQNRHYLQRYLRSHPGAKVNPRRPVDGRIVVGANDLVGIFSDHSEDEYAWLRDNFEPSDHIAYGWLVFDHYCPVNDSRAGGN